MKKPAAPIKTEKRAKYTLEEKTARKSAKDAGNAASVLNDDRADKKASQKKSLKSAAKQLQKELNNRMNEVVARIRKETKAKLKEVVKEATRRLDSDTERMFEQALHTIVRHYDSVSGSNGAADNGSDDDSGKAKRGRKKGQALSKDGGSRKLRASQADTTDAATDAATDTTTETPAPKTRGRKPGSAATKTKATATGARRGPKPGTPATGARRGPKPRIQATPTLESNTILNPADSASTNEVSA
ncbi:hypothetical protein [Hymenobacter terrenus]|uniref:hypothetical protein n=1 Tax=Hymenobacter terrenus TaxID=1629124 RepID=UPI000619AA6E|nr:hypothetical protein [Hymenobacter terrenus]